MKLILLAEAQRRFEAEDAWWRENRDAKDLFTDEFEQTIEQLVATPAIGKTYRLARGKLIERVLMKRTRCYIYYHRDLSREIIEIHTIWGARRGHAPTL